VSSDAQDEQRRIILPPETREQPSLSSGWSDAPWLNRRRPGPLYVEYEILLPVNHFRCVFVLGVHGACHVTGDDHGTPIRQRCLGASANRCQSVLVHVASSSGAQKTAYPNRRGSAAKPPGVS
jgi:hypothetical protein